jgi:hypothetical protein
MSKPTYTNGRYRIHWSDHVKDPGPTEALRARGHAVTVDSRETWDNHVHLPPTGYGLPEPWETIVKTITENEGWRSGGVVGARGICEKGSAWIVPEHVWAHVARLDESPVALFPHEEHFDWDAFTSTLDLVRIAHVRDGEDAMLDADDAVRVHDTYLHPDRWRALLHAGATELHLHGSESLVIAPGIGAVAPMRSSRPSGEE